MKNRVQAWVLSSAMIVMALLQTVNAPNAVAQEAPLPAAVQKMLSTDMSKILIFKDGKLVKKVQGCFYNPKVTQTEGRPVWTFCCVETSASPVMPDCDQVREDMALPGLDDTCKLPPKAPGSKGRIAYCTRNRS